MDPDALLDGLNESQVRAVTSEGGPVVVLAGAGSGKTRVLTRRIAWRVVRGDTDPNRILALTFTRAAAAELRERLLSLGLRDRVNAGTFHATALLQLRTRWAERGVTPPALVDRKARLVAQLVPRGRGSGRVEVADVVAEIDWARARLVPPDQYGAAASEAGRTPPLPADAIAGIMEGYAQLKRRKRVVDFDDLLLLAIRDLQTDPAYAEVVRWRFRHFYVDEFQDVNPLQYELLSQWRGGRPDLFVVGDPNQAIYGWNGADPGLLNRFSRREPTSEVIELRENYRSSPQVLALAATLASAPLDATCSDGPVPTITAYPDDRAEAVGVARAVRAAYSIAGDWSHQAVLVRTNAQLVAIEQALHEAGVPTRIRGGAGPLATPEVRTELALLARGGIDLAAYREDLEDRLDPGGRELTVAEIERRANLAALATMVNDYLATDPAPSASGFTAWVATLQSGDVGAERDGVDLATFHGAKGLEWPAVHIAGLEEGFVPIAYASTGAQLNEERRLLYVALTRARVELHLSWAAQRTFGTRAVNRQPSPHLATLAEAVARLGVGPAHRVDWRTQLARSRDALAGAAPPPPPAARAGGGRRGRADRTAPPDPVARRSPEAGAWGLGRASAAGERRSGRQGAASGAAAPVTAGAAAVAAAGTGGAAPDDSQLVYQALVQWRGRRARAADVAPHVVFNDRTLRAIAEVRPATLSRLATIPGMGAAKLSRYGEEILQLVAERTPS